MDPGACRVIYIDERFISEKWISRDAIKSAQAELKELPSDLQTTVYAFLTVFNQVFVCHSGRSFSTKLSELHDSVKLDCTPIIACFDVGSEFRHDHPFRSKPKFNPATDSPLPSPALLRREITFSSESDESYGLQLLSRISSDLQVEEGVKLIIPVAIVQPKRKDSHDRALSRASETSRPSDASESTSPMRHVDTSDTIDSQMMLQCLDAGALDVVRSPLDKAGIMGLTVHAYRIYKSAKKEQAGFMAAARRARKQSWVGVEEEKPYAYLREAMVKKLLKGICEPENVIEDYQHRDLYVEESRKEVIAREVGNWGFCGHDFTEDELVYAGYCMLDHAVQVPELQDWRMSESQLLHFMQGCRVSYNSFVLYHNFRHAVDVLQSLFYFICQIGILPPYPVGSETPPYANKKSPIAKMLGPYEALTLLISAIGHDVGHPGVNNMFLVKLNAPLAQLYNDQSVLEAFHCAAYSQILRRHWEVAFNDKSLRRLMISSILATDMGVHSDYMQQLGQLQEKIHESQNTDSWSPKDVEAYKVLTCGLLIKCADISNVARPWLVAEKWTHLLQKEFAHQGEMENAVGMDTTLFGGPPELGNMLKLANGQIGFMTIFAHPLFANVADIIPAMNFAADEILTNKGVWFTRAEKEKRKDQLRRESGHEGGAVSPRSQSPVAPHRKPLGDHAQRDGGSYFPNSPLRNRAETPVAEGRERDSRRSARGKTPSPSRESSNAAMAGSPSVATNDPAARRSSGASKADPKLPRRPSADNESSNSNVSSGRRRPNELPSATNADESMNRKVSSENEDPKLGGSPPVSGRKEHLGSFDGGSDDRIDDYSMRAGSDTIPTMYQDPKPKERATSPLSQFTFATSDETEPVRTYNPAQHYPPLHQGARASVTTEHLGQSITNESTTSGEEPSTATDVSSIALGEEGHPMSPTSDFEARRHRALSAPMQANARKSAENVERIGLRGGVGSQRSLASRESSQNNVQIGVMNGETVGDEGRGLGSASGRPASGTMRRRSRIRIAFGKMLKRGDSEDASIGQGQQQAEVG